MLESVIENYLIKQVEKHGGEIRKAKWIGRRGAPDRLVMFGGVSAFLELKRPGKTPTKQQLREHETLHNVGGFWVEYLDTIEAVDDFILRLLEKVEHRKCLN